MFIGLFALKDVLDEWFVSNERRDSCFVAISITVAAFIISSTKIVLRVFSIRQSHR